MPAIDQIGIALTGVTAIFLTQSKRESLRRWAPVFGMLGQPFWVWSAMHAEQWGVLALTSLYTLAWAKGLWQHWLNPIRRPPDFVIGPPERAYLLRWWVIPRNRWFNVYLHQILRDDDDRAMHDHPWWNLSIILKGCYRELRVGYNKIHRAGSFVLRSPTCAHRLELVTEGGGIRYCWSLFITGPRVREWYFHCPQGLVHWKDFVDETDKGNVGRGCGEKS